MPKVLILTPFSYPSKCGIWTRAWADAMTLKKAGFEVSIFSSNKLKGTSETLSFFEELDGVKIYRFPVLFSLGGNSMFWFFLRRFLIIRPKIVHTHGYRHPHSLMSLFCAKLLGGKAIITTHAPFEKDKDRPIFLKLIDDIYDLLIGWWELNIYDRVIRISNWEQKYLKQLGKNDSIYIPNGISETFFEGELKVKKRGNFKIIYMGRLDPIKRPDWVAKAAMRLPDYQFKIWGPLSGLEDFEYSAKNLEIIKQSYELSEFKKELDESNVYLLMSTKEGLPFTLLEAMSRGVIVITSNTNGAKDVITDSENGFIVNNIEELVEKLTYVYNNWDELESVRKKAVETAKKYRALDVGKTLLNEYNALLPKNT